MVMTKEERLKEYQIIYYQNNKDKIIEYQKKRAVDNREAINLAAKKRHENNREAENKRNRIYYHNNKEDNKEHEKNRKKIYAQTPAGKKTRTMSIWRWRGVINVTEKMYNDYIATTHCECCLKEFSSSRDRCLDHDHETGEFRWVICQSCNNQDNWKKIIG
tara:strand:+ start:120 stop:602 length:483 start_codon:yes stop_codon:yes gene_type:complete